MTALIIACAACVTSAWSLAYQVRLHRWQRGGFHGPIPAPLPGLWWLQHRRPAKDFRAAVERERGHVRILPPDAP